MDNAYKQRVLKDIAEKFQLRNAEKQDGILPVGENQGEGYQMPKSMQLDPELQRDSELNERNQQRRPVLDQLEQSSRGLEEMQARAAAKAQAEKFAELRKRLKPRVESFPAITNDE